MIYRFRVILDNDTEDDIFRDIEINKEDKKIILFFYKKYNQNLYLKKTYSKKLNKLNNQNTSLNSYVYLGNIIINLKEPGSPVLIKDFSDKNSFHVVMPMKI